MSDAKHQLKGSGNNKFKAKDYAAAEADYTAAIDLCARTVASGSNSALNHDESVFLAVLYSNRAACRDALNNEKGAMDDASCAMKIDPLQIKSYFRLAKLLYREVKHGNEEKFDEARRTVAVAIALSRGKIDPALDQLYQAIRTTLVLTPTGPNTAGKALTPLWLPTSTRCIRLVAPGECALTRTFAFDQESLVVCALPGKYKECIHFDSSHKHYVLLGIGNVVIDQMPFTFKHSMPKAHYRCTFLT